MARLAALALLAGLLLSGCSGGDPVAPGGGSGTTTTSAAAGTESPRLEPAAPVHEAIAIAFEGNLGTSAHGCVFPAGTCHTQSVTPGASDLIVERPGANLTGLVLDVAWQAATPATELLVVGAMVMAHCEGCESTPFLELAGPSPLHLVVEDVDVPLTADAVLHVYAYNPRTFSELPGGTGYALASVDQAFRIDGNATVLLPAV